MSFYEINLGILCIVNAILFLRRWSQKAPVEHDVNSPAEQSDEKAGHAAEQSKSFLTTYLSVYLLATAADWLQGPHIYAIYRLDKHLAETTTAALYAIGFISGAVSSAFVGQIADRHGRRTACLIYCATYLLSCLSMLTDQLAFLFIGRVCGGVGTTLLYTSFESWMMTEYHHQGIEATGLSTATVFSRQTTLNSVVAILSGVTGEILVSITGTRKAPFMLAGLASAVAAVLMLLTWTENYGHSASGSLRSSVSEIVSAARLLWKDQRVFALTVASSTFESMMYLFVFFWSAAITSARTAVGTNQDPPFGLIFACFMCSMMAGSQIFDMWSTSYDISIASNVLEIAMTAASLALMSSVVAYREDSVFWAFCTVEVCVGLYFPSMNFLKGQLIEDGSRAKMYSLMRLPLNALVITAHAMAEEGDHHRNNVFLSFGGGVLLAFVTVRHFVK